MLVVFYHYGAVVTVLQENGIGEVPSILDVGNLKTFGAVGVPIFFVISGFVIGLQRFTPGLTTMRSFVSKRVIRLVPLYWTMTIVFLLALPYTYTRADVFASLAFVHLVLGGPPIIQPGWSLEYEMFFYAAFAVVVTSGLFATRNRGILVLLSFFVALYAANLATRDSVFAVYGNPLIFEFALGLLIAQIYRQAWIARLWPVYLSAALTLFVASNAKELSLQLTNMIWAGGAFFLVLGLVEAEVRGRPLLSTGLLRQLGDASYAIYLSHMLLVHTLFVWPLWHWQLQRLFEPHVALILLATMGAVFGWLVHKFCEAPMTTFLRGLAMRWSGPPTGPSSIQAQRAAPGADLSSAS